MNRMHYQETIAPRARLIIDNDFGGDPDGLFQLAHHLLSPTMEIRAIIGSHHYESGFFDFPGTSDYACEVVNEMLETMQMTNRVAVYQGANSRLQDIRTPIITEGANFIVREAMREDTDLPLYIACGAGLTDIASAFLMEPRIAQRLKLIWIGGPEHEGLAIPPPGGWPVEYNLGIDILAAQVIFNVSDIQLWQVPRDAYRQTLTSYSELLYRVKDKRPLGEFLVRKIEHIMQQANRSLGEAYALGDNPLVLLTALQSSWEPDPSSSQYISISAPIISEAGLYQANPNGRKIRVYTNLDVRLMLEDFYAKIALFSAKNIKL